jgi:hypothetical protein
LEEQTTGRVSHRFEWSTEACAKCPLRQQCLKADQKHRTLAVGEHHTILQGRRREQKTEPFKRRMKHRKAIEGTQSELVRAHGLRRARYRGLPKAKLQNYFVGAACNIKRWLRRAAWELQSGWTAQGSAAAANGRAAKGGSTSKTASLVNWSIPENQGIRSLPLLIP